VWEELLKIPYGETRSYKQIAEAIENPKACRAVGGANNKNALGIIIPCHRVVGADCSLIGYGGGLDRKRWLLEHETRYTLKQ
jgi:methylated-DNA-[protein]-cysteine S-methyltransferase